MGWKISCKFCNEYWQCLKHPWFKIFGMQFYHECVEVDKPYAECQDKKLLDHLKMPPPLPQDIRVSNKDCSNCKNYERR